MKNDAQQVDGRRPLKSRNASLARKTAQWLSSKNITPNQISVISIVFAALAASCLLLMRSLGETSEWILPILAAIAIQGRLLCNLFDGMVAVEGGKSTLSGELYNDIPDRISDSLILVALGYAATVSPWAVQLGWCAALLAVMTAYVRTLAASMGGPTDFRGPMAKQHRMAVITIVCLASPLESLLGLDGHLFFLALCIIIVGCVVTAWRRIQAIYDFLENK